MEYNYDKVTLLTPAALLGLLSQIEELSDCDIGLDENTETGELYLYINDNSYLIQPESLNEVEVDESVMDQVEESVEEGYEFIETMPEPEELPEIQQNNYVSYNGYPTDMSIEQYFGFDPNEYYGLDSTEGSEKVEGGIVKNAVKSLMLGGMIRFANKHLLK